MLVIVNEDNLKGNTLKATYNSKKFTAKLIVDIDDNNMYEMVKRYDNSPNIVAFRFKGLASNLHDPIFVESKTPIYVDVEVESIREEIHEIMVKIPPHIRVYVKVSDDYHNLEELHTFCTMYPNLHVQGGHLFRINGVRIGVITNDDLPKKIAESRIPRICREYYDVLPIVDIEDLQNIEFTTMQSKVPKEAKPKVVKARKVKQPKVAKPKEEKKVKPKTSSTKKFANLFGESLSDDPFANF